MNTYTILFLLFLAIITLQVIVTYQFTNTKEFSKRALIRNISIGFSVYFAITTKKYYILFLPILVEIIIEGFKWNGIFMEKYIATKYQYNDYWTEVVKKDDDNIFSNFSEANYDNILGFSTTDLSQENIKNVLDWTKMTYNKSLNEHNSLLTDMHGVEHDAVLLKKTTDDGKYKLICEKCNIQPGMKILEIGFGNGDCMDYIYKNYGIKPIGVNISKEQVASIKERGYEAYTMDAWEMTVENIGTFDLILQLGNLEYIKCQAEPNAVYEKYANIIKSLLHDNGKYFITCIHRNINFKFPLYDKLRCYVLWSCNDGFYPESKIGFSKYAEKVGLKNIYQEDRTIDYWVATVLFMSYFQCRKNNTDMNSFTYIGFLNALFKTIAGPYYLHTYLCYSPTNDYFWLPWLWQFVPQEKNGKLEFPTTLEYILFEKEKN